MTRPVALRLMSNEQLINEYQAIGLKQDDAILANQNSVFRTLYTRQHEICDELKARGLEARRGLTRLLHHPNIQVRVNAARDTLAVAPLEARAVLREILASRIGPQCLDAGLRLRSLDNGSFTPS